MTSPIVRQIDAGPGDVIIVGPAGHFHMHRHADGTVCASAETLEVVSAARHSPALKAAVAASWEAFTEYGRIATLPPGTPLFLEAKMDGTLDAVFGTSKPDPAPRAPEAALESIDPEPAPYLRNATFALGVGWGVVIAYVLMGVL